MERNHVRRVAAFALLAAIALGSAGCQTTYGVGVGTSVYGGWGGYGGHYGGGYAGGPIWP